MVTKKDTAKDPDDEHLTLSALRANIYKIFDQIIETGTDVKIERKGVVVTITAPKKISKLDRIKPVSILNCDADDIIYNNWESEWNPDDIS